MATHKRSTNGHKNGNGRHGRFDPGLVLAQAQQVTTSANEIAVVAGEVSAGAEQQLRSLNDATMNLGSMTASLKESAANAESIAAATEELVSGITEMAASIDQVSAGATQVATAIAQNSAGHDHLGRDTLRKNFGSGFERRRRRGSR